MSPFDDETLELAASCIERARERGCTLATAESCTGGLVGAALSSISGASWAYVGSVVSYAIPVKEELLGVSGDILSDSSLGAVSSECALEMARGVRTVLGADIAISITGIAGPTGAEPNKPVGTVWIAWAHKAEAKSKLFHFLGSRDEVRAQACTEALKLMYEAIVENEKLNK